MFVDIGVHLRKGDFTLEKNTNGYPFVPFRGKFFKFDLIISLEFQCGIKKDALGPDDGN